jgi:hypothetical protein
MFCFLVQALVGGAQPVDGGVEFIDLLQAFAQREFEGSELVPFGGEFVAQLDDLAAQAVVLSLQIAGGCGLPRQGGRLAQV